MTNFSYQVSFLYINSFISMSSSVFIHQFFYIHVKFLFYKSIRLYYCQISFLYANSVICHIHVKLCAHFYISRRNGDAFFVDREEVWELVAAGEKQHGGGD